MTSVRCLLYIQDIPSQLDHKIKKIAASTYTIRGEAAVVLRVTSSLRPFAVRRTCIVWEYIIGSRILLLTSSPPGPLCAAERWPRHLDATDDAFGRLRAIPPPPQWVPPNEVRYIKRVAVPSRDCEVHTACPQGYTSKQVGSASNSLWMARSHYCEANGQGRRLYRRSECLLF